ncbi:hypothetical protein H0H92_006349 [Tricholoma furcatifolium]|nr:hypothetical protein H0H92_006349 [Tricholoma furcatifolium]
MASDPRVQQKPRLPKAYTPQQLTFLKSNLAEFERRSQGSVRGDAKKFALERASDFIAQFGLPPEFIGIHEADNKFREVGPSASKLRKTPNPDPSLSKSTIGSKIHHVVLTPPGLPCAAQENPNDLSWNPVPPNTVLYSHAGSSSSPANPPHPPAVSSVQYATLHTAGPMPNTPIPPVASPHINLPITKSTIRDAFLRNTDASSLANMIQSFVMSDPTPTPLTAVVEALFEALSSETKSGHYNENREALAYLRRYLDTSGYFSSSVIHAGVSGMMAGPRAIQMQVRRFSTWVPSAPTTQERRSPGPAMSTSISEEMQRIALDRQRRKDHIQWANIHAAALELGMLGMGHAGGADNSGYAYAMGRAFSEMIARDAVWESDEVEWVAGICVLRAVIRTAMRGDRRQRDEYDELLRTYEKRWKEIKDETRQSFVTEVLLAAKEDLARLDESLR